MSNFAHNLLGAHCRSRCQRLCLSQVEEEDRILAQAEKIAEARKAAALAKRPSGAPLLHHASFSNSIAEMPFFDHAVTPFAPPKPGVYLRRAALEESKRTALAQQAHGAKASKLLDSVMNDIAQVCARWRLWLHLCARLALAPHLFVRAYQLPVHIFEFVSYALQREFVALVIILL